MILFWKILVSGFLKATDPSRQFHRHLIVSLFCWVVWTVFYALSTKGIVGKAGRVRLVCLPKVLDCLGYDIVNFLVHIFIWFSEMFGLKIPLNHWFLLISTNVKMFIRQLQQKIMALKLRLISRYQGTDSSGRKWIFRKIKWLASVQFLISFRLFNFVKFKYNINVPVFKRLLKQLIKVDHLFCHFFSRLKNLLKIVVSTNSLYPFGDDSRNSGQLDYRPSAESP